MHNSVEHISFVVHVIWLRVTSMSRYSERMNPIDRHMFMSFVRACTMVCVIISSIIAAGFSLHTHAVFIHKHACVSIQSDADALKITL